VPHEHAPENEQLSAFVVSHVTQEDPPEPQFVSEAVSHVEPTQQPLGQEPLSQTHDPPWHTWPIPQAGLDPHVQAPLAEHVSAEVALHALQATAPTPHVMNADGWHVEPEQQPIAQLVDVHPLQAPPGVQVCGLGHDSHAPPPLPQSLVVLPFWQTPLASQQPVGQDVALQTHLLPEQT
jgi:hypothetical protein